MVLLSCAFFVLAGALVLIIVLIFVLHVLLLLSSSPCCCLLNPPFFTPMAREETLYILISHKRKIYRMFIEVYWVSMGLNISYIHIFGVYLQRKEAASNQALQ